MASAVLKVNEVYQKFWTTFSLHCKPLGDIRGNPHVRREGATAKLDCLIFLKGWPYKAQSEKPGRTLDILIRAVEQYSGSLRVKRSVVHVLYLSSEKSKYRVIQNVHYDFADPPDQAHPIFHAQFGNKLIEDLEKFPDLSLPEDLIPQNCIQDDKAYKNLRIPSAHMNLASVLFSLAADHMEHERFGPFLKSCSDTLVCIPDAECEGLRTSCRSDSYSFKSLHWYYPAPDPKHKK